MTSAAAPRGIGLGLRVPFADALFDAAPPELGWLEVHPENYIGRGGRYADVLQRAAKRWPIVTHGLTMGFAQSTRVERERLTALREFADQIRTPWHSDHLAVTSMNGIFAHDLLPMPWTREALRICAERIRELEDALDRPVLFENLTYYATAASNELRELDFIHELLAATNAKLLLDINNVYVNAQNHGFDARTFIDALPLSRVQQIHVAGHLVDSEGFRIDTHAEPICDDVYALFERVLPRTGHVAVLLERDANFDSLDSIVMEVKKLDAIYRAALGAP